VAAAPGSESCLHKFGICFLPKEAAKQQRPHKCRRQKCDDDWKKDGGEISRECADDAALKPNKPFECARPGLFWPHGETEHTKIQ
jgi:hypothetical protein